MCYGFKKDLYFTGPFYRFLLLISIFLLQKVELFFARNNLLKLEIYLHI